MLCNDALIETEFGGCQACGSLSVILPAVLSVGAPVACGRCGEHIATWTEFCDLAKRLGASTASEAPFVSLSDPAPPSAPRHGRGSRQAGLRAG